MSTAVLLSTLLRTMLPAVTVLGKCMFRILKGWGAETCMRSPPSLAALFTTRQGPADHLILYKTF